jgi:GDPmannose 4,6-dehydratase
MAEYLLEKTDHEVVVATRRTSHDNTKNLSEVLGHPRFRLETVDLADAQSITALIRNEKPDYFINLGGSTFVPESASSPASVLTVNSIALIHILEAVRQYVPHCRVFSAGSSMEAECSSIYAVSKIAAGNICRVYRERYGMYVVHGIMHNHVSPHQAETFVAQKVARGVARIAKAIKEGKSFDALELGNLDARKDFSHASDFVDGIWKMLNQVAFSNGRPDSVSEEEHTNTWLRAGGWSPQGYTLCSGESHSVRELVEKAFDTAGVKGYWFKRTNRPEDEYYGQAFLGGLMGGGPVEEVPGKIYRDSSHVSGLGWNRVLVSINPSFYRPLDTPAQPGDSSAIRRELGWSPQVSFDDLVREMVLSAMEEISS